MDSMLRRIDIFTRFLDDGRICPSDNAVRSQRRARRPHVHVVSLPFPPCSYPTRPVPRKDPYLRAVEMSCRPGASAMGWAHHVAPCGVSLIGTTPDVPTARCWRLDTPPCNIRISTRSLEGTAAGLERYLRRRQAPLEFSQWYIDRIMLDLLATASFGRTAELVS